MTAKLTLGLKPVFAFLVIYLRGLEAVQRVCDIVGVCDCQVRCLRLRLRRGEHLLRRLLGKGRREVRGLEVGPGVAREPAG